MKYMNMKEKFFPLNLQLFAEDDGPDGDDTGGDDQDDDDSDEGGDDDDSSDKKYTEDEMEAAVKKRLAREKRKWKREQDNQKNKSGGKNSGNNASGEDGEGDKETQELREKAAKADDLELKWTCLEHDVDKSCVDDVIALAKVHMAKDEDMDIEDAIDAVLKKYPQFKESSKGNDDEEDETRGKSWGQRQNGRAPKKMSGVEKRFYELNPDLK